MHKKRLVIVCIFTLIILLALFFRIYNYYERLYIYADNALFVQAAYYAFENFKLPQIGPFAQAPFFTGPWWLWILQIFFLLPFGFLTPWYIMTFLSLIFIIVIFFVGKSLSGIKLGLLASLLAAISTAQIDNSFMTWNAAADPFLGLFALLFFLKYRKSNSHYYLFALGFTISLAITIHFQTFLLSPLIVLALLSKKPKLKNLLALALGILIPQLPFLYFDLRFNWFELRRILDYLLIGQKRIYVPNRWLTYVSVFWVQNWAFITGGKVWLSYTIFTSGALTALLSLRTYKKNLNYFLLVAAFGISIILLRYYRGERFFYYTNYAHAFVLLITGWTLVQMYKWKRLVGAALAAVIIIFTASASVANFTPRVITLGQITGLIKEIYTAHPQTDSFAIYECPFNGSMISTPVSYIMYYQGKNTVDGLKIGVCNPEFKLSFRQVQENEIDKPYTYQHKSTPTIYTDMTEWFLTNPPTSLY